MSVLCGRCGQQHPTIADVRQCHAAKPAKKISPAKSLPVQRRRPTGRPRRPKNDARLEDVKQVLVALAGFCEVSPSLDTLEAWSKDPWTRRIVGYRMQMLLEVMDDQTCPRSVDLPKFLGKRLEARAKLAARDASMLLEGRSEWKLSGGSRRPADVELHKRIGPVDFNGN